MSKYFSTDSPSRIYLNLGIQNQHSLLRMLCFVVFCCFLTVNIAHLHWFNCLLRERGIRSGVFDGDGRLVPCKKWTDHLFVLRRAPELLAPAQYLYSLYEDHKACQSSILGCHVVDLISWVDCYYGWYIYVIQSYGNVYFVNCFLLKNQYKYEMIYSDVFCFCVCVYIYIFNVFEKSILCSLRLDFGKIVGY